MGWESSDVVRFDLGPLLQGEIRTAEVKSDYNLLSIGPTGLQCETNLLEIMGWESSALTLGTSFKVRRWFTGLGSCLSGGYKFCKV